MTGVIAAIRPDEWNFPLLVHVLGAMILVGAVLTAVVAQLSADATGVPDRMRSVAFRTLLFVGIPAWFARPLLFLRDAMPAQIVAMRRSRPPSSRVMAPTPIQAGSSSMSPNSLS